MLVWLMAFFGLMFIAAAFAFGGIAGGVIVEASKVLFILFVALFSCCALAIAWRGWTPIMHPHH
ncbi:MAG: DUF1328 domain-containing protein [Deltaproteobacteria bacterium]|nr:DUF1328 domain-containing protein [Deltaproteobacteria bacterium]